MVVVTMSFDNFAPGGYRVVKSGKVNPILTTCAVKPNQPSSEALRLAFPPLQVSALHACIVLLLALLLATCTVGKPVPCVVIFSLRFHLW